MHRKVAAALVAALALGLASCGGSSSSEELTRAQLVSKVEVACRQAQRDAQARARASRSRGTDAFVAAVLDAQRGIVSRIDDYNPPDELSDAFDTFKQEIQARTDLIARFADSGDLNDQRATAAIQPQIDAIGRRLQSAGKTLGIRSCI